MNAKELYPNKNLKNICYINNIIKNPNVIIGDYTYYNCEKNVENFEKDCILCHYKEFGDKLIIGKFCSIGENVKFMMNAANHNLTSISTYPFTAICDCNSGVNVKHLSELPNKGDTIIGNDVWIGMNTLIMPGVHIGDGAVIGANSVVAKNVEPYTIVAGNPIKEIRKRFSQEEIKILLDVKWWNWDIEKILKNLDVILSSDIMKLYEINQKISCREIKTKKSTKRLRY